MRVGFVGLGKLGLPCALAIEAAGHEIAGYDVSDSVFEIIETRTIPYMEEEAQILLTDSEILWMEPPDLEQWADLVFVAVQTPHRPEFEGVSRLPDERADFNYHWLREAVASVANAKLVVLISTVLPGTVEREVAPLIPLERLLYNPFFIAMGTTIPDFRDPEFVLVGTDMAHPSPLRELYKTVHSKPMFVTTIKTAELTKVLYNTFIGLKIAFANTVMELAHKTGADADDVVDALTLATERIISPTYMRGGMGDGGGCHPRDNIALSWLAREVGLSYDLFSALMECREKQTEWLADLIQDEQNMTAEYRPIVLEGEAYKPRTNLTVGSPARLLAYILEERGISYEIHDPHTRR